MYHNILVRCFIMADEKKWESALAILSKVSANDLSAICHRIAESFCRDGVLSADKFLDTWSLEEWWDVRSMLTDLMKKAVGKQWSKEQVSEALGSLDPAYKKVISQALSVHEPTLRFKLLQDTTAVSHAVLADFDWKLKLAMSSDKLASLQEPLLQVDFNIREADGKKKTVNCELDEEQLKRLITSLEGCSKSVQQMTTSA